jgi:quinol monooxygenase YgiN
VILLSGHLDVDPDQRDTFITACQSLMTATRAEPGCGHYAFSADLDDPGRFHVAEQWADEDAIASHSGSPHMAEFLGAIGPLVRGADITKWTGATGEKFM